MILNNQTNINSKIILHDVEAIVSSVKNFNRNNFQKLGSSIINQIEKIISLKAENKLDNVESIIKNILLEILDSEISEKVCYLKVMDYFPSMIWRTGLDAKCNFLNKAWIDFTGNTFADEWTNNIHKDDIENFYQVYNTAFNKKIPFTIEYRLKKHDGQYYNIIDSGRPFYNESGNFEGFLGTCNNITDKIEYEQKLKESNDQLIKLLTAVQQTASIIVITDLNGNIEFVNKKFSEVTGYTFDEAIGQNPRILKTNYLTAEMYKKLWDTISGGNTWEGEFHNKKKNGELFWEKATISPVFNSNRQIINYIAIKEDITEKKLQANKMQEHENLFNKIMNSANDAITLINSDGNIVFWNQMAEKIFGYSFNDIKGQNLHNLIVPSRYHNAHNTGLSQFKKNGNGPAIDKTIELTALNKKNEEFPVELSLSSTLINEKWHAIGIIRDITERKNNIYYLEKLNNTKNQLISIIGHDLRSSFLTINGFSKMITEKANILSHEQVSLMSSNILNTTINSQRLLENIILWAKSQSNSIIVEYIDMNLNQIISDCILIHKSLLDSKQINVIVNIADNQIIKSDKNIISTVVRNIISNAVKYSNENSAITINVCKDQNQTTILVNDQGIGFNTDTLKKLNNNENITSSLGTHKEKGTGMGLKLCKSMLENIGSRLEIQSELNVGTTVKIIIPE